MVKKEIIMKKITFRSFLKYSLACICATCAMIAGVFAMSTNTVKAEVLQDLYITTPELEYDSVKDKANYSMLAYLPVDAYELLSKSVEHNVLISKPTQVGANITGYESNKIYTSDIYTAYFLRLRSEKSLISYKDISYDKPIGKNFYYESEDKKAVFNSNNSYNLGTINTYLLNTFLQLYEDDFENDADLYLWVDIVKATKTRSFSGYYYDDYSITINKEYIEYEEEIIYTSDNYKIVNPQNESKSFLENVSSSVEVNKVNKYLTLAGTSVRADEDVTVNLTYKRVKDFAQVETITEPFLIKGRYIYNEGYIKDYMYNVLGYANISDLNAVYTDSYIIDGSIYDTQDRVFLQAESLDYAFNSTQNVGTLNVVYAPFKYSNFVIRITNNDPTNNLTIDYFTSNVVDNGSNTTLTYDFNTIERQLFNSAKWLFDIQQEDFTIISTPNVTTSLSDTALTITFSNSYENSLSNLSVMIVTEIMEDYELNVTYGYAKLNEDLTETRVYTDTTKMYYSDLVALGNENFKTFDATKSIYELAINSIKPEVLNGQAFYTYKGISKDYTSDKKGCIVQVEYDYTTLLKVTDSLSTSTVYVALDSNSLTYTYDDLPFSVPNGWRIKNVTKAVGDSVRIVFSEHTPEDLTVTINESTSQKKIITLTAELSDKWYVKVNYLERYKNTPFATLETVTKEVKVSEYGEIKNINANNTAKIVGKSTLNVLKSAVEKLDVQYNGTSTYTITPKYTYLSLKAIDYNGNSNEVKVPLTCYEQYCDMFGHDWSILWLNTIDNTYFEFSNSVERNKLYGYFNVAVFETQVSDLNALFSNNTGDGCMTVFRSQQIVGSNLYRFANNMKDSALFGGAGYTLMSFCEIANDNNKILDSYFFFLDITSDKPFLSNGGADNSEDDDSAGENFGEDVVDGVKDKVDEWGASFSEWFETNPFAQFLKILGYVLLGGVVLFVLVWLFKKVK